MSGDRRAIPTGAAWRWHQWAWGAGSLCSVKNPQESEGVHKQERVAVRRKGEQIQEKGHTQADRCPGIEWLGETQPGAQCDTRF